MSAGGQSHAWIRRRSAWSENPELTTRLIELWNSGKSATQIMFELGNGLSRNAILGRVMRLRDSGIEMKAAPVHVQKPRAPRPPRPPLKRDPIVVADPDTLEPIRLENGDYITVLTVSDRHCRWPIGDPQEADFRFCGHVPKPGSPYCPGHHRKAVQPKFPATTEAEAA